MSEIFSDLINFLTNGSSKELSLVISVSKVLISKGVGHAGRPTKPQ